MDVHVPRAVTTALRLRSIDVPTAQEDGAAQLDDDRLLTKICYAKERGDSRARTSRALSTRTNFASQSVRW